MAGIVSGVYNNSTKTELAGVIAKVSQPGGLHIALDNAGVVTCRNEDQLHTARHLVIENALGAQI